jgi:PAS domain-containing protein
MDRWLELWKRARGAGAVGSRASAGGPIGSLLPVELSLSFLRFRDAEYLVVYLTDVTERRRALAALRESEARLKGLPATCRGWCSAWSATPAEGDLEFPISEGSEALVGYTPSEIQHPQMGLRNLVHPRTAPIITGSRTWPWPRPGLVVARRILTRQGEQRWADIKATTRRLGDGRWCGTAWSGTSPRASGPSWRWPGPRSNCASCRRTWRACAKKKRPASPGKCTTNWGRC